MDCKSRLTADKTNPVGQEYRIAWKPVDAASAKAWLVRRGGKPVVVDGRELFEFRFGSSQDPSAMPDAFVLLEEEGVYFCDYARNDKSAVIFRDLIDEALTHSDASGSVVVHDL
ncbi:MAG: hypothetical protein V4773_06415 [Verrucomicrobiota bacterium]